MTTIISTLRRCVLAAGVYLLAGVATPLLAQNPSTGGPQPSAPDPTQVPIDGGASVLLAAGAAYGLKRLRTARRPKAK
jgi:hypothetical protein